MQVYYLQIILVQKYQYNFYYLQEYYILHNSYHQVIIIRMNISFNNIIINFWQSNVFTFKIVKSLYIFWYFGELFQSIILILCFFCFNKQLIQINFYYKVLSKYWLLNSLSVSHFIGYILVDKFLIILAGLHNFQGYY